MSNIASKTSTNVLYQARCAASAHNEQLKSRESTADIMSIDRGRLYRIESGVTDPYPEEIHMMADLYGAPELRNWYCRSKCPLGKNMPEVCDFSLDRISIRALSSLGKVGAVKEMLLSIVADGIISEDERPELEQIIAALDELNEVSQNLKNWAEKNMR
jgi:transcriptional regulator with XRE-family HTH domain